MGVAMVQAVQPTNEEMVLEDSVRPQATTDLNVGVYEAALPLPRLRLEFDPKFGRNISSTLIKREGFGEYLLILRVKNAAHNICKIKLWSSWLV